MRPAVWFFARYGRADLSVRAMPEDADVCGPTVFLRDMRRRLRALGVPDGRVHIEQFTPGDAGAPERVAR